MGVHVVVVVVVVVVLEFLVVLEELRFVHINQPQSFCSLSVSSTFFQVLCLATYLVKSVN